MIAAVTGAGGFIGSWLCRSLAAEGVEVVAVLRRDPEPDELFARSGLARQGGVRVIVRPDLDEDFFAQERPALLFHLAGLSQVADAMRDPAAAFAANAEQAWRLFDVLRRSPNPPATVFASTDAIYGETAGRAASEDDPLRAVTPYEASKAAGDLAARCFARRFGLPLTVARLGNVYGPGDANEARLVPGVLRAVRTGTPPHLRGGGRAVRALLHVDDAVAGLRLLAEAAARTEVAGEAFNLSSDTPRTTLEIARAILSVAGRPDLDPVIADDAPGETSVKISSSARIRTLLGWRETVPFEAGIRSILQGERA